MTNLIKFRSEGLKEIIDTLESVFSEVGIDFYYLIGAIARDIWYEQEKISSRTTRDIDFAILVSDKDQFEQAKEVLQAKHGFRVIKGNEFALESNTGVTIDILPFGAIEVKDGITIQSLGIQNITLNGFKEIAKAGVAELSTEDHTFKIATLPSIVLLKLISFDDRPEHRQKDPSDIAGIIQVYFDLETNVFYDTHYDLLERIDEGKDVIAARLLGRQMRAVLAENSELKNRIKGILQKHISVTTGNVFTEIVAKSSDKTIEEAIALLSELLMGIEDK